MQIFHLGLHKTGTTSLQKNLFYRSQFLYHGPSGHLWKSNKNIKYGWYDFFMGQRKAPLSGNEQFIYSSEGTLLRCGGMSGVENVARQIANNFSDPRVLITVREPSALLVSAYFQSLLMRRYAIGFDGPQKPVFQKSVRFIAFEEWWGLLTDASETSLAGLLDYIKLQATFEQWLKPHQIVFLKLEDLVGTTPVGDPGYTDTLRNLGFGEIELEGFLSMPPENTGFGKELQRARPLLSQMGKRLEALRIAGPIGKTLRATRLMRYVEKILYSGEACEKLKINHQLLNNIKNNYRVGFDVIK